MNQNTSVDSDLQKAIDDITKSTNGDPLFADPVAAPAPLEAPGTVGPFPIATPAMTPPMAPPAPVPNPIPVAPAPMPNFAPEEATLANPATLNTPAPELVTPAEPVSAPSLDTFEPAPVMPPVSTPEAEPEAPVAPEAPEEIDNTDKTPFVREGNLDIKEVKEAALRELAPVLSKLDVPAKQKFDIYKNVIDNYHDTSVIPSAYRAASEIEDERDRGEALLYIVESIDKM